MGRPPAGIDPAIARELRRLLRRRDRAAAELEEGIDRALEAGTPPAAVARTLGLTRAALSDRRRRREARGRNGTKPTDAHGLENQDQP
jgi:CRP-like cAMP-binding protein